jgi:hypothetical protein
MKKTVIISSLIFLVISLHTFAQPRFTPQERLKILKERLTLTEEQSVKVEKILIKSDEDLNKLQASENSDRTKFRKIMDDSNQEILNVLNEKQKTEYKKMLEERRNRSGEMRGGRENDKMQNLNKKNN